MKRDSRFEALIGKEQLSCLQKKKILIVGCGGVGGYVIEALARCFVGNLIIIDYDMVEASNCNRQIIALSSTIGREKVECFQKRILEINPNCNVVAISKKLEENNIREYITNDLDYVVDACDDVRVKKAMLKWCYQKKIPYIASMGMGNRFDPSKIEITTLEKTKNDPLARILRKYIRDQKIKGKIWVCSSTEIPIKTKDQIIASCSFVPSAAGLFIASYIVRQIIKESDH